MSFFKVVPNITIMAPKDFEELEKMLEFAIDLKRPVVIRYPRGGEGKNKFEKHEEIELGKSEIIKKGKDLSIIAIGKTVDKAIDISKELEKNNIDVEVINTRFLKPLDTKSLIESIEKTRNVITIEDSTLVGGLGTSIKELIVDNKIKNVNIETFGYKDEFIKHGSVEELETLYGLNVDSIVEKATIKVKNN